MMIVWSKKIQVSLFKATICVFLLSHLFSTPSRFILALRLSAIRALRICTIVLKKGEIEIDTRVVFSFFNFNFQVQVAPFFVS